MGVDSSDRADVPEAQTGYRELGDAEREARRAVEDRLREHAPQ